MRAKHHIRDFSDRASSYLYLYIARIRFALITLLCLLGVALPAQAQNVTGIWTGTYIQSPSGGPFPGGIYDMNYLLYQSSTGTVVGLEGEVITPYWATLSIAGTQTGTTLSLTTTTTGEQSLPFGFFPCTGTTTYSLNSTFTQMTSTGGTGGCGGVVPGSLVMTGGGWSKTLGSPCDNAGGCTVGNPIDPATGNKYETVQDYTTAGPNKLAFSRYYNSFAPNSTYATSMGQHWRTNYDRYLNIVSSSSVIAERADGQQLNFTLVGTTWTPDSDVDMTLTNSGSTWVLTTHDDTVETYTASGAKATLNTIKLRNGYTRTLAYSSGLLSTVTDSYSRALGFTYTSGLLTQVTTPDSLILTYGYNSSGIHPGVNDRLASVGYNTSPATSQSYAYTNTSYPFALTALTDENGNNYGTWTYDTYGRALTSVHGTGSVDLTSVAYNDSTGTRTVTNALGQQYTYIFKPQQGIPKLIEISRASSSGVTAANEFYTYDANGYTASVQDWNGNITTLTNDLHGDPTGIVEASGSTVQRTTTITYDTTWVHLPATVVTPGVTTGTTYDTSGNPLTQTLTDTTTTTIPYSTNGQTRTWHYTWSNFLPLTVKTPNGNTTTYTYDATGALTNVKNALLQNTQVTSHTGGGLPLTIVDPNSVTTTLTYSTRNWPLTSTVATSAGNRTTTNTYDAAGNLTQVTQPDGSYLVNTYDTTHRITKVADSFNNAFNYTLDNLGDKTASKIENPSGTETSGYTAAYNEIQKLITYRSDSSVTFSYVYDANSNPTTYDPPSAVNYKASDAINRQTQQTYNSYGTRQNTYDAHNRPLTVTDRNGYVTSYVYDGFGDLIQIASPDAGTSVFHYDSDGNMTSKTDAASIVTNHTYDALDRVLTNAYPADTAENVTYTYDQTGTGFAFGIGHVTTITDMAGTLTRTYDERANIITDKRVNGGSTFTTTYGYDAASRRSSITYPSGAKVAYTRDAMGRITSVTNTPSGGSATTLASSITYEPFGPWTGLTYGSGVVEAATYDLDYKLQNLTDVLGSTTLQSLTYTYNAFDVTTSYVDHLNSSHNISRNYDGLRRVSSLGGTSTIDANNNYTAWGSSNSFHYTTGTNRLSSFVTSGTTTTVTTDANGNITGFSPGYGTPALSTLTYNNSQTVKSMSSATATLGSYVYDAFGFRYSKTVGSTLTTFTWSPEGTLLSEKTGSVETDYVYVNGRPIAQFNAGTSTLTYLIDDKNGRPLVGTTSTGSLLWSQFYDEFGNMGGVTGTLATNLRLPGQYADAENGTNYNVHRYYIPALTRYLQYDPLGLNGGNAWDLGANLNPYVYVGETAWDYSDPLGLEGEQCTRTDPSGISPSNNDPNDAGAAVIAGLVGNPANYMGSNSGPALAEDAPAVAAEEGVDASISLSNLLAPFALLTLSGDTPQNNSQQYLYHFTDDNGYAGISATGVINPSLDGYVYMTPMPYQSGILAQQQLSLSRTPTGYFQVPMQNTYPGGVSLVAPLIDPSGKVIQPGGGVEVTTSHAVPVGSNPIWVPIKP